MKKNKKKGTLYIVSTPIGNLEDMSYRAINTLKNVQLIAAEDTRHTYHLLKKFNISTSMISFHKYNENKITKKIIVLLNNINIALVSDAGTPTINDPGYKLVYQCHINNIIVVPIPGPCALIAALSVSGIPNNNFYYKGFFPKKLSKKINILKKIKNTTNTIIFYETNHRILKTLNNIKNILGKNRIIVLAKEITKIWEKIKYGTVISVLNWLEEKQERQKGEIVIIIKGIKKNKNLISNTIHHTLSILLTQLPLKQSVKLTSMIYNNNKNFLYQYALKHFKCDKK